MINLKYDQGNGIKNIFNNTSNDSYTYLLVYVSKLSKFDDISYESLYSSQGMEEL